MPAAVILRVWMGADIHSPALTIRESLVFSAETRLLIDDQNQLQEFVDEVPPDCISASCMPARKACQPSSWASWCCTSTSGAASSSAHGRAQVLALMELDSIRGALVGIPGRTGLSVEQRKRLTIGVELVSNPSVIFMVGFWPGPPGGLAYVSN